MLIIYYDKTRKTFIDFSNSDLKLKFSFDINGTITKDSEQKDVHFLKAIMCEDSDTAELKPNEELKNSDILFHSEEQFREFETICEEEMMKTVQELKR